MRRDPPDVRRLLVSSTVSFMLNHASLDPFSRREDRIFTVSGENCRETNSYGCPIGRPKPPLSTEAN
jgi:hypothetical protein